MNAYIKLNDYRLKFARDSYRRVIDPVQVIHSTLSGTRTVSSGVVERRWGFDALYQVTADGTYADYEDVQTIIEGTSAAQRAISFTDVDGTAHTGYLANVPQPKPLSRDYFAAGAWWTARFEVVEQ